jgi:hypothetical protein
MSLCKFLGVSLLLAAGIAAAAPEPPALMLSPDGKGQMLIFPYYTTAAGNSTLLTLSNHGAEAKVLRVRIAEGENGQDVLSFHLYLAVNDIWTGVLFDRGEAQTPGLLTQDQSCTLPSLRDGAGLPQLPDGRRYTPLRGGLEDGGSTTPVRLREGFVEVLEVASIVGNSASDTAVFLRDCAALQAAWNAPDGYWQRNPLQDLLNPTDRISGEAAIVNVAAGTMFGLAPVAINGFRTAPRHIAATQPAGVALHKLITGREPPLATLALTDPSEGKAVVAQHQFYSSQRCLLSYPVPQRAADAVSALLMAEGLNAPYEQDPAIGASTSYVLTYPTRHLYTNPQYTGAAAAVAPFSARFQGVLPLVSNSESDSGFRLRLRDREAQILMSAGRPYICGFLCQPMPSLNLPGTAIEVVALGGVPDPLLGSRLSGHVFQNQGPVEPLLGSGQVQIDLTGRSEVSEGNVLRPSLEGYQLSGLPVIGTRLINYVNANALPGMLANYAAALPMMVDRPAVLPPQVCPQ